MATTTPIVSSLDPTLPLAEQAVLQWKRDVFLSFRGTDTRKGITSKLFYELDRRRIKTYKDDQDLEVGMTISPSLLTAIEESRFAVVVLSPNYATSPWCLDELVKICQCKEGKETILPLFYKVEPSDVRFQKNSFGEAFAKHEKNIRQSKEKLIEWRDALHKVAQISGWELKDKQSKEKLVDELADRSEDELADRSEDKLVHSIVEYLCNKVKPIDFEAIMSTKGFEAFESTRRAMEEVVNVLKDDKVNVISIHGMGGVGKTTMVIYIASKAQKDGLFDHIIMATVSQNANVEKVQGALADMLRLPLRSISVEGRAGELKERISRGNKILIILDDIWNKIELSSIGIPSQDELHKCNSKLMFTTRSLNVCHQMRSQANIPLDILSDDDSWNLFMKKARISLHESSEFTDVALKVAKKCGGLPVALTAVAIALADKNLEEWEAAVVRLERSQMTILDKEEDVFKCIKLSYDYLKSEDTKGCLLLCCLFPEDYDINVEDLITYGFGNGLFRNSDTIQEARDTAHSAVSHLKASSLLLESKEDGCVKMHDVIRDVATSISESEKRERYFVRAGLALEGFPQINTHYTAISLLNNNISKLPEELHLVCPKLHILLLQNNVHITEIPNTFFESQKKLRVLDLSGAGISVMSLSLGDQINLRALYLDHCDKLVKLSIIGNLKTVQILRMRGFPLKGLPKEVGEMRSLRMLDISDALVETIPSGVFSKLSKLEELYMQCRFSHWGEEIRGKEVRGCLSCITSSEEETNADFGVLTGLVCLKILKVRIFDSKCLPGYVERLPNWTGFHIVINSEVTYLDGGFPAHSPRYLSLNTTMKTLPDWFIEAVTAKAEELTYADVGGYEGLLELPLEHHRGRLYRLKSLALINCSLRVLMDTKHIMHPDKPVFENLEKLYVRGCSFWDKSLCVGKLPLVYLCNLKTLKIEDCDYLGDTIAQVGLWPGLQKLETLECTRVSEVKYVFESKEQEPEDQVALGNLREIILWDMEKLVSIWQLADLDPNVPPVTFHNLKVLRISWCPRLSSLFPTTVAQCLLQLEELEVIRCSDLVCIIRNRNFRGLMDVPMERDEKGYYTFKKGYSSTEITNLTPEESTERIVFPKLKKLELQSLSKLKGFIYGTRNATIECPSLQHLRVISCPEFSTSISDFQSNYQVQVEMIN